MCLGYCVDRNLDRRHVKPPEKTSAYVYIKLKTFVENRKTKLLTAVTDRLMKLAAQNEGG